MARTQGNGHITRDMRDPVLDDVLDKIQGLSGGVISARTGVSASTIYNWRNKKTRRPQNITMEYALRAAGYRRVIVPL